MVGPTDSRAAVAKASGSSAAGPGSSRCADEGQPTQVHAWPCGNGMRQRDRAEKQSDDLSALRHRPVTPGRFGIDQRLLPESVAVSAAKERCQRGCQWPDFAPVRDHPPMVAHACVLSCRNVHQRIPADPILGHFQSAGSPRNGYEPEHLSPLPPPVSGSDVISLHKGPAPALPTTPSTGDGLQQEPVSL